MLASLDDWSWKAELASSQSKYEAAMMAMQSDLARQSPKAGQDRAQAEYLRAEMQRSQTRLSNAQLRSPIDGVVITADLQNFAGKHLDAGAPFGQVLDLETAMANVAIDEEDAPLLANGQHASIKLNSFPARVTIGGCEKQPASPAQRTVRAATTPVSAQPVASPAPAASTEGCTTTGPLVVDQQADILAERDGRLVEVRADIGDHVLRGQLLVVFDDRELRATRAARAAKTDSLKALVREGEAEQQGDAAGLRRADYLFKGKIISEEDFDHVKFKLGKAVAQVESYRADVASSEQDLHALDVPLEQSRVVAPFSGVIGRRNVRVAQEVRKGDALMWLTAEAPLHILFTVPESAMAQVRPGALLELTSPLYPGLTQKAVVHRVGLMIDPSSGSVEVVGTPEHPPALLRPGMSMQIRLNHP